MTTALNLDAYFERIEWGGDTAPTLRTLAGLVDAHMRHIPFENLDILLGKPVRLDLSHLQDKLVRSRRGGYCFEHATLFAAVLERLGFAPIRHSARVVLFVPATQAPRTHMFLTVPLAEGVFVVDPGFGGLAPRFPVPLSDADISPHLNGTHWMVREGGSWVLKAQTAHGSADAWISTLEREHHVDFEMGNHYTATYPGSVFVNRLMLRAFTPEGRVSAMNRDVTIQHGDETHATQLSDRSALRALLVSAFGFDLPEVETLCVPSIPEWR